MKKMKVLSLFLISTILFGCQTQETRVVTTKHIDVDTTLPALSAHYSVEGILSEKDLATTDEVIHSTSNELHLATPFFQVSALGANIREEAAISSKVLTTVTQGDLLLFLNKSVYTEDGRTWFYVQSGQQRGYISAKTGYIQ
jgi:uncharacterized protein YcfL